MIRRFGLLYLLAFYSSYGFSQQVGCFREIGGKDIALDTKADFSKYSGFFVGEVHVGMEHQDMKLAFLKYLNKQFGVTDVFMEFGYTAAFLYNQYLATGDSSFVSLRHLKIYMTEDDRQFWKDLYEYNKTLDKKIVIHGMDLEDLHFVKPLYLLMPKGKDKPAAIAETLSAIEKNALRNHSYLHYNKVKRDMLDHMDLYRDYYGDNFRIVSDVMFNPNNMDSSLAYARRNKKANRYFGRLSGVIFRDSAMCVNVKRHVAEYNIKKFVVFVGLMHTYKARRNSLYTNMTRRATSTDNYANIALTFKNSDPDAKYTDRYRYLIALDKNDKEVSYATNYAILEKVYEKHYNRGCKYTMIDVTNIGNGGNDTDLKDYTDYLIMMEDKW